MTSRQNTIKFKDINILTNSSVSRSLIYIFGWFNTYKVGLKFDSEEVGVEEEPATFDEEEPATFDEDGAAGGSLILDNKLDWDILHHTMQQLSTEAKINLRREKKKWWVFDVLFLRHIC